MCVVFLAFQQHPDYPLIVAANRDEFHQRPSKALHIWQQPDGVFGGQDQKEGGSWFLANRSGNFATVTNIREGVAQPAPRSRGELPLAFIGAGSIDCYLQQLMQQKSSYGGFNLLGGDSSSLWHANSSTDEVKTLSPGIYGLSNGQLDDPWPKVSKGKTRLATLLNAKSSQLIPGLFELLNDQTIADDNQLPDTGVAPEWEKLLSPVFICHPVYGTRCSTLLIQDHAGRASILERNFRPDGTQTDQRSISYVVASKKDN